MHSGPRVAWMETARGVAKELLCAHRRDLGDTCRRSKVSWQPKTERERMIEGHPMLTMLLRPALRLEMWDGVFLISCHSSHTE